MYPLSRGTELGLSDSNRLGVSFPVSAAPIRGRSQTCEGVVGALGLGSQTQCPAEPSRGRLQAMPWASWGAQPCPLQPPTPQSISRKEWEFQVFVFHVCWRCLPQKHYVTLPMCASAVSSAIQDSLGRECPLSDVLRKGPRWLNFKVDVISLVGLEAVILAVQCRPQVLVLRNGDSELWQV